MDYLAHGGLSKFVVEEDDKGESSVLKFGKGNAKLGREIHTFSLPAGHACPAAKDCLSKADAATGRLIDGPHMEFRCFSASAETMFTNVRKQRWNNFNELRELGSNKEAIEELIVASLPTNATKIRLHVSGDFYNQAYFDAWLSVATSHPSIIFYGYTKSLKFWVNRFGQIPDNFRLVASKGGMQDGLIGQHGLKFAEVVYSVQEAEKLGLEIDHDDTHAYNIGPSFALLIHGKQPTGSDAAAAKNALNGFGGYSRHKRRGA